MSNSEQRRYWNEDAGRTWVLQADALDCMLHDVGEALLVRTPIVQGQQVLDIGCGSGAFTFAVQERVGIAGKVMGLDISSPLIALAKQRAATRGLPTTFAEADAATWHSDMQWDGIVSRFGVMFFADPVAAFRNMATLCRHGGYLSFVCWCNPKESDMAKGMMNAVAPLFTLPATPPDPNAPGPYAFANQDRVRSILQASGWSDIVFEHCAAQLPLPGVDVRESAAFAASIGAIARLVREQNVPFERVIDCLVPFLEQRRQHDRVVLRAEAWLVAARSRGGERI
jgi:SAM-dependent methyltransferase